VVKRDGTGFHMAHEDLLEGDVAKEASRKHYAGLRDAVQRAVFVELSFRAEALFQETHNELGLEYHLFCAFGLRLTNERTLVKCLSPDGLPPDWDNMDSNEQFEFSLAQAKCNGSVVHINPSYVIERLVLFRMVSLEVNGTNDKFVNSHGAVCSCLDDPLLTSVLLSTLC